MWVATPTSPSMIQTADYTINVLNTKVNDTIALPYSVKISFECADWDQHFVRKCERDFRKLLSTEYGQHIGCYFDRYSMTAILNFRNEDDAARFILTATE